MMQQHGGMNGSMPSGTPGTASAPTASPNVPNSADLPPLPKDF
jgi:hypothetical protein